MLLFSNLPKVTNLEVVGGGGGGEVSLPTPNATSWVAEDGAALSPATAWFEWLNSVREHFAKDVQASCVMPGHSGVSKQGCRFSSEKGACGTAGTC